VLKEGKMVVTRNDVAAWLIDKTISLEFEPEAIDDAISLFDQVRPRISPYEFQEYASTCYWIAVKLKDDQYRNGEWSPLQICDFDSSPAEVERKILLLLDYHLRTETPYSHIADLLRSEKGARRKRLVHTILLATSLRLSAYSGKTLAEASIQLASDWSLSEPTGGGPPDGVRLYLCDVVKTALDYDVFREEWEEYLSGDDTG
jgi:hypothetical protein